MHNYPLPATLHLKGETYQLQKPLVLINGVTYAPFREVFTILGAEIGYTTKHNRMLVWADLEEDHFLLESGATAFYHNDLLLSLPGAPPTIAGTLYFPLRSLLDCAGYQVYLEKLPENNNDSQKGTNNSNLYLYRSNQEGIKADPSASFNPSAQRIPVLMYHHLVPGKECDGKNGAIISVEAFAEQMEYLFANGYRTVSLQDLFLFITGKKELPPRSVVLTFDDGYASNYEYAYPIMKKYRFHAVQFPITGKNIFYIPRMTTEMMEASKEVFEFHSHSHDLHHYIDGKQALLVSDPEEVRADLSLSRELLDCFAFAYPYGAFNEKSIEMLKETGYKMAFTVIPGYVCPGDDLFRLKRIGIYPETRLNNFIRLLENENFP